MKKLLFLLTITLISLSTFAQKARVVKDAQGRVHERYNSNGILTEENEYKDDKLTSSVKYDDRGNQTEEVFYTEDGKIKEKNVSKYDVNNNRIELVLSNENGMTEKIAYTYDKSILSSSTGFGLNNAKLYEIKYDNKGNKISETNYTSDGSQLERFTYSYDIRGYKQERIAYGKDDKMSSAIKYDIKENKIEEIIYDGSGNVFDRTTFAYDDTNKLTERIVYDASGKVKERVSYVVPAKEEEVK